MMTKRNERNERNQFLGSAHKAPFSVFVSYTVNSEFGSVRSVRSVGVCLYVHQLRGEESIKMP